MSASAKRPFTREQRTTIVYGILGFVLILVVLQLWLLTATMNAYLGGDDAVVWPAAAASVCRLRPERRPADLPGPARQDAKDIPMKHHTLRESIMLRRFVIATEQSGAHPQRQSGFDAAPAFLPAAYVDTGVAITESAVVADVDRDGNPDLIVAIQNHSIGTADTAWLPFCSATAMAPSGTRSHTIRLAAARLRWPSRTSTAMPPGHRHRQRCGLAGPVCGPGTAGVLLNHGDGTFADAVPWDLGVISQSIAIADVNGDGKPDLVAAGSLGGVSVLLGNGDGTFQRPIIAGVGTIEVRSVAVADMNRDGRLDVVATGADTSVSPTRGAVAILPGNGNGTFQPPPATYDSGVTAGGWSNAVAVADLQWRWRPRRRGRELPGQKGRRVARHGRWWSRARCSVRFWRAICLRGCPRGRERRLHARPDRGQSPRIGGRAGGQRRRHVRAAAGLSRRRGRIRGRQRI